MVSHVHPLIFFETVIKDLRKMKLLRMLFYAAIGLLFAGFVYSSLLALQRIVSEAPENFMIYGF